MTYPNNAATRSKAQAGIFVGLCFCFFAAFFLLPYWLGRYHQLLGE